MFQAELYNARLFSSGLDEVEERETLEAAIAWARKRVRDTGGNAVILDLERGARLMASVVKSKGRVLTRRR